MLRFFHFARLCCTSSSMKCAVATRCFATEVEKTLNRRRYNPRDQFGTLKQKHGSLQTERLQGGFENPWLAAIRGEELLEEETKRVRQKWEMNADKFKDAPVISIPFRAKKKLERQRRKELKMYMKELSLKDKEL